MTDCPVRRRSRSRSTQPTLIREAGLRNLSGAEIEAGHVLVQGIVARIERPAAAESYGVIARLADDALACLRRSYSSGWPATGPRGGPFGPEGGSSRE
jgi:hypothetical protein